MGSEPETEEQDKGVHVKISPEMLHRLDAAARSTQRSRSGAIRLAIVEWLDRYTQSTLREVP